MHNQDFDARDALLRMRAEIDPGAGAPNFPSRSADADSYGPSHAPAGAGLSLQAAKPSGPVPGRSQHLPALKVDVIRAARLQNPIPTPPAVPIAITRPPGEVRRPVPRLEERLAAQADQLRLPLPSTAATRTPTSRSLPLMAGATSITSLRLSAAAAGPSHRHPTAAAGTRHLHPTAAAGFHHLHHTAVVGTRRFTSMAAAGPATFVPPAAAAGVAINHSRPVHSAAGAASFAAGAATPTNRPPAFRPSASRLSSSMADAGTSSAPLSRSRPGAGNSTSRRTAAGVATPRSSPVHVAAGAANFAAGAATSTPCTSILAVGVADLVLCNGRAIWDDTRLSEAEISYMLSCQPSPAGASRHGSLILGLRAPRIPSPQLRRLSL
ncbi:MAG: hypothetical protein Q9170_004106 [Blastenia crenularia]